MKRIVFLIGLILLGSMVGLETASAQRKVTIKLASLAPENTDWGRALNRMAKGWADATNGQVELRVFHNGVMGDEATVFRLLKQNQIQGAVFTSFGMKLITPDVLTLSVPFLIRNDGELDAVLNVLKPELEARINEQGFFTLAWSKSGWVKIFSKTRVLVPDDLKRLKVGTNKDSPELTQALKTMGYQMIPVGMNDVLVSLNSGMIDAVYQSPMYVGAMQIFGVTKNMASINLAPFMGGIILNNQGWRTVPDQYKAQLQTICQSVAREIDISISQLETNAIKTMVSYGLVVNQISPEQEQLWYTDIDRTIPSLLGSTFSPDIYKKIDEILQKYRSGR
jgi:TRAP-type C4-dicarboxylate transport system substrate-binding protein